MKIELNRNNIISIISFVVIMIVAVLLRCMFLHTDVWYDEACSWVTAKQSFPGGIIENLLTRDLQHTPIYFFLLHFWMKMFGEGELAMRTLSVIFGIASVPLVYTAAKKITSKINSLLATAVVAVSPLLVIFSVEVRMYPIVVFLVLLSLNYLIDFEKKEDIASLVKLVIVNTLIPYTLVGGILYNLALVCVYSAYLFKSKKDTFYKYIKGVGVEFALLMPYFILLGYYAKMRSVFVISHEGYLEFFQIVDVIRNFFGSTLVNNIYWPSMEPYEINFLFAVLVVVPCVYFILGLIKCLKSSNTFVKVLCSIFVLSFIFSIIVSMLKVNVFTVRYILYLLPPLFIFSIFGLFERFSSKHVYTFLGLFIIASLVFCINDVSHFSNLKTLAFKTSKMEADKLNLSVDDVIIMPFGADAPYYFRSLTAPRVFDFDFHKEARNPYNNHFYDSSQQVYMDKKFKRSQEVYYAVFNDNIISKNYVKYFFDNVTNTVPSGRFVLLALYGSDANAVVSLEDLRKSIPDAQAIDFRLLDVLFKKYMIDTRALLDLHFNLVKVYSKDNFTFYLYQKK